MSIPKEQEEQGKGILKEASDEVGEGSLQGSRRYKCRRRDSRRDNQQQEARQGKLTQNGTKNWGQHSSSYRSRKELEDEYAVECYPWLQPRDLKYISEDGTVTFLGQGAFGDALKAVYNGIDVVVKRFKVSMHYVEFAIALILRM